MKVDITSMNLKKLLIIINFVKWLFIILLR